MATSEILPSGAQVSSERPRRPDTDEPSAIPSADDESLEAGLSAAARGDFVSAQSIAWQILASPDTDKPHAEARALFLLGLIASHTAKPIEAVQLLERAVEQAQGSGDSWCVANALCSVGRAHMHAGNRRSARTCFSGALELAVAAGDRAVRAEALLGLGWVALREGVYDQAKAMFVECSAVAHDNGDMLNESEALSFLAELARLQGESHAAEERLRESLALAEQAGSAFHEIRATATRARAAQDEGDPEEAARLFDEVIASVRESGHWYILARSLLGRARAASDLGELDYGRQLLEEALDVARAKEDNEATADALFGLGRLARQRGAEGEALDLHHQVLLIRDQIGHAEGLAESLEALAGHLVKTRASTGARLLGAAQGLRNSVREDPPAESCPCCRQDRMAVQEALPPDDFEQAVSQGTGLSPGEAIAYISRGRGPRDLTSTGWDSLSRTERQVADLVADGLSNPEIGDKLFISRRTVGSHLTHVYRKLGISSRRELRETVRARSTRS